MMNFFVCCSNESMASQGAGDSPSDHPNEFYAIVPRGGKPGTIIRVQAPQNSKIYKVEIPEGATPKSTLAVTLPEDAEATTAIARIEELAEVDKDDEWKTHADDVPAIAEAHLRKSEFEKPRKRRCCGCCCGERRATSAPSPWRSSLR